MWFQFRNNEKWTAPSLDATVKCEISSDKSFNKSNLCNISYPVSIIHVSVYKALSLPREYSTLHNISKFVQNMSMTH